MPNWYLGSSKWSNITVWAASTAYNVGDIRRQTAALGTLTVGTERAFRCTTAGTSGGSEPPWSLSKGSTTTDNTVVWTEVTGVETYGWGAAHARLANAWAWQAAGETTWMSNNHAETQSANNTLTAPGTAASPSLVFCVVDTVEPPTTLADTATLTITGSAAMPISAFAFFYGSTFFANGSSNFNITFGSSTATGLFFKKCKFKCNSSTHTINFGGPADTTFDDKLVIWDDCTFEAGLAGNSLRLSGATFEWKNTSTSPLPGTLPTTLLTATSGYNTFSNAKLHGLDLSALGSGKNLVAGDLSGTGEILFSGCKLASAVAVVSSASIKGQGSPTIILDNCDSDDPSSGPRSEVYTYHGSVVTDTAIVRTGGASDGTPYSLKMTANAAGVSFFSPLVTKPIRVEANTVGSPITVTTHIAMEEGATPLTESECWMEVEYMGTSASALVSLVNDHNSTVLSLSATARPTSSETWTGFTGTPVKQKLEVTFTPQEKGFYYVRIHLARVAAVTTAPPVYVCHKFVVS